jgi:hypothetical protein
LDVSDALAMALSYHYIEKRNRNLVRDRRCTLYAARKI